MQYPTESQLKARVDRLREEAPGTNELADAIFAYVETLWFQPNLAEPLLREATEICERTGSRLGLARAKTALAELLFIKTRYQESLPLVAEVLPVLIEHHAYREYGWCLVLLAGASQSFGAYDSALEHGFRAMEICNQVENEEVQAWVSYRIADVYRELGDNERMLEFAQACYERFETLYSKSGRRQHRIGTGRARTILAVAKERMGHLEEALHLNEAALERYREADDALGEARAITDIGRILALQGRDDEAEHYLKEGLQLRRDLGHKASQTSNLLALGDLYLSRSDSEAALTVFQEALTIANEAKTKMRAYQAHESLSKAYVAAGQAEKAFEHYRAFHELKDEVAGEAMSMRIHNTKVLAEIARAEKEAELERARSEELEAKNEELARLLQELKTTQDRLIQSEKMASLGQLTAGIAHEIRNPLNFVNNFSELSSEIVDEMTEALNQCSERMPEKEREGLLEALGILVFNTGKIKEHGNRADAIVRSMLQHSRVGKGELEVTDLNELLDEYLNLAYHGMRARESDFNVTLERDYDEKLGKVKVIPQDLGRVFLNLISNAFDALHEYGPSNDHEEPTLVVSTRRDDSSIEIRIADNGPGIPADVKAKIFDPFFTTKAPGSGTGLGLSMSFDIVSKGHGGQLEVDSEPGAGATFIVRLPLPPRGD